MSMSSTYREDVSIFDRFLNMTGMGMALTG